jgi:hypothetical protein
MTSNLQVKLAEFLAEHGNATTSWDELRRAWNRAGDGKRYKDPRSFARAAREAFGTVTGREAAKRPARRGRIARKKTPRGAKHPRRRQR